MPPLVTVTMGLMGVAALARWCVKEIQRVNAELDGLRAASRATSAAEPVDRRRLPTLRRDPRTGEYRPG